MFISVNTYTAPNYVITELHIDCEYLRLRPENGQESSQIGVAKNPDRQILEVKS